MPNTVSKVVSTLEKPLSSAEAPGSIYGFELVNEDPNGMLLFKIGRTERPVPVRQDEWIKKNCFGMDQVWVEDPVHVACCHRVVHKRLDEMGFERFTGYCSQCKHRHREIFIIPNRQSWDEVVKPLIEEIEAEVIKRA
ncbi:hypothetical protein VNI00_016450 [Paramarasmius palmivorus]|uniref:Bacteriophage T5 Orf172 DNA-binding domain-containing protein n=1 Tax=Paramarasmius palmivorus TaxID=297713 RepID=A0AAW0BEJ5_9AGAR